jgi:hypothetical protein
MSSPPATTQSQPPQPPERRRSERRWLAGLIVMVVAILAFTAVAIAIELTTNRGKLFRATVDVVGPVAGSPNQVRLLFHVANTGNRAGRPDTCDAILFNATGERVGVGSISLREPIQPGATQDQPAIGTAAEPPVNGTVDCRALDPG